MLKEFKEFIAKGNVMDMAIGVVLAGAFSAVVGAVVDNILTPIIGFLLAGVSFDGLKIVLRAAVGDQPEVAIGYGMLISALIKFLMVALFLFFVVKGLNRMKKSKEAEVEVPAGPTESELLSQILDELKKK